MNFERKDAIAGITSQGSSTAVQAEERASPWWTHSYRARTPVPSRVLFKTARLGSSRQARGSGEALLRFFWSRWLAQAVPLESRSVRRRPQNRSFPRCQKRPNQEPRRTGRSVWRISLPPVVELSAAATYKTISVPAMYVAIRAVSSLSIPRRSTGVMVDSHGNSIKFPSLTRGCSRGTSRHREHMTQFVFETFNVPAMFVMIQTAMSLFLPVARRASWWTPATTVLINEVTYHLRSI